MSARGGRPLPLQASIWSRGRRSADPRERVQPITRPHQADPGSSTPVEQPAVRHLPWPPCNITVPAGIETVRTWRLLGRDCASRKLLDEGPAGPCRGWELQLAAQRVSCRHSEPQRQRPPGGNELRGAVPADHDSAGGIHGRNELHVPGRLMTRTIAASTAGARADEVAIEALTRPDVRDLVVRHNLDGAHLG